MQGIRCACRRAGNAAQIVLGKSRTSVSNSRWTRLTYQPAAHFHSKIHLNQNYRTIFLFIFVLLLDSCWKT